MNYPLCLNYRWGLKLPRDAILSSGSPSKCTVLRAQEGPHSRNWWVLVPETGQTGITSGNWSGEVPGKGPCELKVTSSPHSVPWWEIRAGALFLWTQHRFCPTTDLHPEETWCFSRFPCPLEREGLRKRELRVWLSYSQFWPFLGFFCFPNQESRFSKYLFSV